MTRIPADFTSRHLAKIIDSSDDAIVSKDLNGIIQLWNAAAERMFGYTAAEAIGRSIRMIIPDDRQSEEDFVLGQIRVRTPRPPLRDDPAQKGRHHAADFADGVARCTTRLA